MIRRVDGLVWQLSRDVGPLLTGALLPAPVGAGPPMSVGLARRPVGASRRHLMTHRQDSGEHRQAAMIGAPAPRSSHG
jgi:hypothetical protein